MECVKIRQLSDVQRTEGQRYARMIAFEQYQLHLYDLAQRRAGAKVTSSAHEVKLALDGQPGRVLKTLVEPAALGAAGAFFTGAKMAQRLLTPWHSDLARGKCRIYDPACGAGDLLLAAARQLPTYPRLSDTLKSWGDHLFGVDIHSTFILSAKARLAILAAERSRNRDRLPKIESLFPGIRCSDHFHPSNLEEMTHVAMNPPFTLAHSPKNCDWGTGLINTAAVFVDSVLDRVAVGTKIAALLPEVLRTGTRYQRWRKLVELKADVDKISAIGHFGRLADVDVFALHLDRGISSDSRHPRWWNSTNGATVGDSFEVQVGPVVPHRHAKKGKKVLFLDSGSVEAWKTVTTHQEFRRFSGRLHTPPFVVVHRTSSPSDKKRAKASTVHLNADCAIENHLLVLTPKSGKVSDCWKLTRHLRTDTVDAWLNRRIRCRHLTVGSVASIPFNLKCNSK